MVAEKFIAQLDLSDGNYTLYEKNFDSLYIIFNKCPYLSSLIDLSQCLPLSTIDSFSDRGKIVASFLWGIVFAKKESKLIQYVRTHSNISDEVFIRKVQVDLNEKLAFVNSIQLNDPEILQKGLLLFDRYSQLFTQKKSEKILLPSSQHKFDLLVKCFLQGKPISIVGSCGSGKKFIVQKLAIHMGIDPDRIFRISAAEQLDAKTLIGSYVCGERPGEFRWVAGMLCNCLQNGFWLVIEDSHLMSVEVATLISRISKVGNIFVSNRNELVRAKRGFALFCLSENDPFTTISILNPTAWNRITFAEIERDELRLLITEECPSLYNLAESLLNVYFLLRDSLSYRRFSNRVLSARDLLRWCQLIISINGSNMPVDGTISLQFCEGVFKAALISFVVCISSSKHRQEIARSICTILYVSEEKAEFLLDGYKPSLQSTPNTTYFGSIPLQHFTESVTTESMNSEIFAYTSFSCRILEYLAACTKNNSCCLLVGETGTGKTTLVQSFAKHCKIPKLSVINMNQQSEREDLVGGFRPLSSDTVILTLNAEFESLFSISFNATSNMTYLHSVADAISHKNMQKLLSLYRNASEMYTKKKTVSKDLLEKWNLFLDKASSTIHGYERSKDSIAFSFVEGVLIEAIRYGYWILLDEINLATPEILNMLNSLVAFKDGSIVISERGDSASVPRHPNFRLFACMNPSTDVNKKDLPPSLRNNFIEIYVDELDQNRNDLSQVISSYLSTFSNSSNVEQHTKDVADTYYALKKASNEHAIVDGDGKRPHYSLRTLTRALKFAKRIFSAFGNVQRCLYEGFLLSFVSILSSSSKDTVLDILKKSLLYSIPLEQFDNFCKKNPSCTSQFNSLCIEGFLVERGCESVIDDSSFVITPYVRKTLSSVCRALMARNHPILLQGPTSAGKTSLVEFLAGKTGHRFVRINNHEQTDLQEYIGRYHSSSEGKLIFKEGLLVEALKQGHWLVLDELNLASSDILEALNRLLDDNRELFVAETGEVIKPHPHFQLFATQNPSGTIYGGRKVLSRAFRNRFIEIHVNEIPFNELEIILEKRCQIPPSYCKKLLSVYHKLSCSRESASTLFSGKNGFITLRDLFKWGKRNADNTEQVAENGYLLLAERMRNHKDKEIIKNVIEDVFRVKLDPFAIYDRILLLFPNVSRIVWTGSMKRMFYLTYNCILNKEPVLIVGETGCGKTTVIQVIAELLRREMHILNCHQNTETSDILGSLRPSRDKSSSIFEWVDGPLIKSMKNGDFFLLDEVSLAEDSVLERLNSVLEPSRMLTLAEKPTESMNSEPIAADDNFRIFATMNPGGDFGKKELSPALRNRFTEFWVPAITDHSDIFLVISSKLAIPQLSERMVSFISSFSQWDQSFSYSLRDIISWIQFVNCSCNEIGIEEAFVWGGYLVFANKFEDVDKRKQILLLLTKNYSLIESILFPSPISPTYLNNTMKLMQFSYPTGHKFNGIQSSFGFTLSAPTTFRNALKVIAALSIPKSILLEGSPGVGKTSLIQNIADLLGYNLFRINLSEQTDLCDLFGCDLPSDEAVGSFSWKDGPFLTALKNGDWILLDELNLASQSILEGLNSCLDHRGTVFIPEINQTFTISQNTRIFASQNPLTQGYGRKGLPKSFLNRFTCLYLDSLNVDDYEIISQLAFENSPECIVKKMVSFVIALDNHLKAGNLGSIGGPWEINLRDINRWIVLLRNGFSLAESVKVLFFDRFRSSFDVELVRKIFSSIFNDERNFLLDYEFNGSVFSIGSIKLEQKFSSDSSLDAFPVHSLDQIHSFLACIKNNWLSILVGDKNSGKSRTISFASQLLAQKVVEISMNSTVDASDLLGGFEQYDSQMNYHSLIENAIHRAYQMENYEFLKVLHSPSLSKAELINRAIELNLIDHVTNSDSLSTSMGSYNQPSKEGSFVWIDGPVIRAMLEGFWIVLDNANLCSPAVLDRLNSLFENDGYVLLNEQGSTSNSPIRKIYPHPNFRLVITMNPIFGEISRAMRNRGVEIFFSCPTPNTLSIESYIPLKLSPVFDSFSFNYLTDKLLFSASSDDFATALFMSTFKNEIDYEIRCQIAGNECDSSFLRSFYNILVRKKFQTNVSNHFNRNYYEKSLIINESSNILYNLKMLFINFDGWLSKEQFTVDILILRIFLWKIATEPLSESFFAVCLNFIITELPQLNLPSLYLFNDKFKEYWNDQLCALCFYSKENLDFYTKCQNIEKNSNIDRRAFFDLFIEFLQGNVIKSIGNVTIENTIHLRFSHYNYSTNVLFDTSKQVWNKFVLMEQLKNPDLSVDIIQLAVENSSLSISFLASLFHSNINLQTITYGLRYRSMNQDEFSPGFFFKNIISFCSEMTTLKMFQIPKYISASKSIVDCLLKEWSVLDNFTNFSKDIPFESEFTRFTKISIQQAMTSPVLILDFVESFLSSCDLALVSKCSVQFESDRKSFVQQYNSLMSNYSMIKFGAVRSNCLLSDDVQLSDSSNLRNSSIFRCSSFSSLSDEMLKFVARIRKSSIVNITMLSEFIDSCYARYPDFVDYLSAFGFLLFIYYFVTNDFSSHSNYLHCSVHHFHLLWLLTGKSSEYSSKLLSASDDLNSKSFVSQSSGSIQSEFSSHSADDQEILKDIFNPTHSDNFSLLKMILNDSIETATHYAILHSVNSSFNSYSSILYALKDSISTQVSNFFTPNVNMMLKGSDILHSIYQKCTYYMINNEELSENPILLNILTQIQNISNLSSNTPLCSVVNGFESFLTCLYNWQQYAHRAISLENDISSLSDFVLECRKYEVESYDKILEMELEKISYQQINSLINEIISITLKPTVEDKAYSIEYLKSLDHFILSSTIGDFFTRIQLLRKLLVLNPSNYLLRSFLCYYDLVIGHITNAKSSILSTINKEYEDFLKVVKWKNINVLHLKQSTEKSHKTIAKLIRKLRTELMHPTILSLNSVDICKSECDTSENTNDSIMKEHTEIFVNSTGDKKISKCMEITKDLILKNSISEKVQEFFDDICERNMELSSMSNVLSLKTKAFDDLLKYLKTKGLKSQHSEIDSFELTSILPLNHLTNNNYPEYYYKCVFMLNKLINAFHSHSSFIDHAKATKLTGFSLNLFNIAKSHFSLLHQLPAQSRHYSFCIENMNDIKYFAANYKVHLVKIEHIINRFKLNLSVELFKELHVQIQLILNCNADTDLQKIEYSLKYLLTFSFELKPMWLFFEMATFIKANSSLSLTTTKKEVETNLEKELIFYQNLSSLTIENLVDDENVDLIDRCFSKLMVNDTKIKNLLSYTDVQGFNSGLFGIFSEAITDIILANSNALFKLTYLLCKIGTSIFASGFCNEHLSESNENTSEEHEDKLQNGTGVGEGDTSDCKNVSDTIEEESQVEGLKQDVPNQNNEPSKDNEDESAFDMEMDFDAEMQDKDIEDGSAEEENDENLDEVTGDCDSSFLDRIDEEFWEDGTDMTEEKVEGIDNFKNEGICGDDAAEPNSEDQNSKVEENEEISSEIENDICDSEDVMEESSISEVANNDHDENVNFDPEQNTCRKDDIDNENEEETKHDDNELHTSNRQNQTEPTDNENLNGSGCDLSQNANQQSSNENSAEASNSLTNSANSENQLFTGTSYDENCSFNPDLSNELPQKTDSCLEYSNNILSNEEMIDMQTQNDLADNQLFNQDNSTESMSIRSFSKQNQLEISQTNELNAKKNSEVQPQPFSENSKSPQSQDKQKEFNFFESHHEKQSLFESTQSSSDNLSMNLLRDDETIEKPYINNPSSFPIENDNMEITIESETANPPSACLPESIAKWEQIESKIQNTSYELCEQLRLILEPTLASRLRGSYKSGKRLDMKKIIPYIASDFRKDKIWLRRTKPAARQYQILVSIDDSKSMQIENAAYMAFESLALIAKALSTLESGQIGVLAFGSDVKTIHNLSESFVSSNFGPKIIENIQFSQSKTNLHFLMNHALQLLSSSRISSADWQLHIILSDGIIHENNDLIRGLVRKCFEHRILTVFVIIDCKQDEKNSITKMSNVTYVKDPITGITSLQMQRYLDSFPFEHYLIIRNVSSLPSAMSEALRQWFDLIRME